MRPPLTLRPMRQSDLAGVVAVHRAAFKGFFLDRMGPAFLRGYYAAVLDYKDSISLVAIDPDGRVTGFVVGFVDPNGFYSHFRQRRLRLAPAILLALIRRPWLLIGILRNTSRVERQTDSGDAVGGLAELASIGASHRGGGVGSALLKAFLENVGQRGCRTVRLTTDEADNDAARAFYLKHGFVETGREQRGRRTLVVYIRQLDASSHVHDNQGALGSSGAGQGGQSAAH